MYFISKGEAQYMDANKGRFSRSLAKWAIDNMEGEGFKPRSFEETEPLLKEISEEDIYSAWYLFNMALADYPKCLPSDNERVMFVKETINDPDGDPEAVLACFRAKMDVMGVPIHWERYL